METTLRKPSIWHRSLKNNVDRVLSACYRQNFVNIVLSLTYRKIVSINCFMLSDLQTKLCWHCFYFNLHTKLCHPYFKFNLQTKLGQHCFKSNIQTKLCQYCFYFDLQTELGQQCFYYNLQTKLGQYCF